MVSYLRISQLSLKYHVGSRIVDFSTLPILSSGGEGDVYKFNKYCIKIFHNISINKKSKLVEIVKHSNITKWSQLGIAYPLLLVYDTNHNIVGYSMEYFPLTTRLLKFSVKNRNINEITKIIGLLKNLHILIKKFTHMGFVISDWNPANFLVSNDKILLIDIDSWGYNQYIPDAKFDDYLAPEYFVAKQNGRKYRFNSDDVWYGFCCLVFALLFQESSYFVQNSKTDHENKLSRISYLHPSNTSKFRSQRMAMYPTELLVYLRQVFENDLRGEFPDHLFDLVLEMYFNPVNQKPRIKRIPQIYTNLGVGRKSKPIRRSSTKAKFNNSVLKPNKTKVKSLSKSSLKKTQKPTQTTTPKKVQKTKSFQLQNSEITAETLSNIFFCVVISGIVIGIIALIASALQGAVVPAVIIGISVCLFTRN